MLTNLHVKNLALIDELEIEFENGLNILTGETGAGKSIIIGSINLALGAKMNREMVRESAPYALVELVFYIDNPHIQEKLKEKDVYLEDGQLILSRKMTDGRSVSKINGETVTLSLVREIAGFLLDIHGQHEHQSLLYPQKQLEILDAYGGEEIQAIRSKVEEQYNLYRTCKKELESFQMDEGARLKEISFLEFEMKEIEEASLSEGEDITLETRYRKMCNSRKIAENLNQIYQQCGYESMSGAGEQIGNSVSLMQSVLVYDEELEQLASALRDVDNLLNDFNRELTSYMDNLEFSEEEFHETEERLNLLNGLKAKYGNTIEEILEYQENTQKKLERLNDYETQKKQAEERLDKQEQNLKKASQALSHKRMSFGKQLEQDIIKALQGLNFLETKFQIAFEQSESYHTNGWDEITFLIATNPGEKEKPLDKVVSGGELSRIMLALKTILAKKDDTDTLIFDEIDTGISGRTAQLVSEKMAMIARNHQVLCITHLAQIAAMADSHYEIAKRVEDTGTHTRIRRLSKDESVEELARILGGAEITPRVLENAAEMKALAQKKKMTD
ncbi:MAG: DNA repair protein RecN [Lachnospiraceae bacterium]|nr:DNA repair protein RecN [Lachnospiraceae bacterium]MDD3615152.1 DNA repair protein RecN [Lachnospiraceae bacterium]